MKTAKPITREKQCVYQYYNKEKGIMSECGKQAVVQYGSLPLCKDCAEYVLSQDKSCKHLDRDGKIVKNIMEVVK